MYDNRLAVSPNAETERILATAARFRLVPILRKYRLFLSPVRLSGQSLRSISQARSLSTSTSHARTIQLLIHH